MSEAETRAIDRASPIPFYYQLQEILKEEIERGMYVLALIAVVVSVDILFFRHHFTEAADSQRRDCSGVRSVRFPDLPRTRAQAGMTPADCAIT